MAGYAELKIKKIRQQAAFNNEDVLTIEDYKRLLRMAKRMNMMQTYYIMLTLAMTGIRIEELKYFTVENLEKYYIKVFNKGKERSCSGSSGSKERIKEILQRK